MKKTDFEPAVLPAFFTMNLSFEAERMSDEFVKYHIRGLPVDAVIHHFTGPDRGHPHDHPWGFTSFVLKGSYVEQVYRKLRENWWETFNVKRSAGEAFRVEAEHIHKIVELPQGECITLILPDPWKRHGGFWDFTTNPADPQFIPFTPK